MLAVVTAANDILAKYWQIEIVLKSNVFTDTGGASFYYRLLKQILNIYSIPNSNPVITTQGI